MTKFSRYRVETSDIDGREVRAYQTRAGAGRWFKEMSGYDLPEEIKEYCRISDFGCVVTFSDTELWHDDWK